VERDVIVLEYKAGASRFIVEAVGGAAAEVACWGARGDWKTSAAFAVVLILANLHRVSGGALPMRWLVLGGTHVEHGLKLCRSAVAPHWGGLWSLREDKHLIVLTLGVELAHLDLVGAMDPGALDRLRMETHAVWAEEVAPAAYEGGSGVPLDAWHMAISSCRLPTPRRVAVLTSNLPDEDYWAWLRFEGRPPHPETVSVRIPPGESANAEDRARWAVAWQNRPDWIARFLQGEPGSVAQGPAVAKGYNPISHVAARPLPILVGETYFGWDSAPNAHTHAVVIGQRVGAHLHILAGLYLEESGFQQFLDQVVRPWCARYLPWALNRPDGLIHRVDPNMDTEEGGDYGNNPTRRLRTVLGGHIRPGPVDWPARIGPLLEALNMGDGEGGMAFQIDPGEHTLALRKALAGRWHYRMTRAGTVVRDEVEKPDHPWEDLGDGLLYLLGGMQPGRDRAAERARRDAQPTQYARSALSSDRRPTVPRRALGSIGDWP
jgi:hypothetical protein